MRYGIMEDYDYNQSHKRKRLTVWSGPFASVREGEAYSLPKGDGYMLTLEYGDKIRVTCPVERTNETYLEQDKAFNDALNAHYGETPAVSEPEPEPAKPFKHNGKRILSRR
jgi:hypothetical protein